MKGIRENLYLLLPAAMAMGMYGLVYVEDRYVAAFVLLFWAAILSGMRLLDSKESRRLATCVTLVVVILFAPKILGATASDLIGSLDRSAHQQWEVAEGLRKMGVQPGDKVATIGSGFKAYWARLARVSIVAEIPREGVDSFWAASPSAQSQVMPIFAKTGAKVVVAEKMPSFVLVSGWQRIGTTDYYRYLLH